MFKAVRILDLADWGARVVVRKADKHDTEKILYVINNRERYSIKEFADSEAPWTILH